LNIMETAHLNLREMTESDAAFYLEMLCDPDFKTNIADRGLRTEEAALDSLRERVFTSYEVHGFGMYLVSRRSDGEAVGMAGLVKRDFLENVDLGYAFLPRGRGQGFATEASRACVELAREQLGIRRLAAITAPENIPSIRVLEKLGFRKVGTVQFPDDGDLCTHFLLDLESLPARKSPSG
jgi:ribosomal-protein-alanine N-acetyltransferase